MGRLGTDKPKTLYVGPLMKAGLQAHMDNTGEQNFILKDRKMPPKELHRSSTLLFCGHCGSSGPFVTDGDYYKKEADGKIRQYFEIQVIVSTDDTGTVHIEEDTESAKESFSLAQFKDQVEGDGGWLRAEEFMICVRCGGETPYIQEDDYRVDEFILFTNDLHFRGDAPTGPDPNNEDGRIDRGDMITECAECWGTEGWVEQLKDWMADSTYENWRECPGGLCSEECVQSSDMWLFDITAGEVAERRTELGKTEGGVSDLDACIPERKISRDRATISLFDNTSNQGQ